MIKMVQIIKKLIVALLVICIAMPCFVIPASAAISDSNLMGSITITGLQGNVSKNDIYAHIIRHEPSKRTGWEFYPHFYHDSWTYTKSTLEAFATAYGVDPADYITPPSGTSITDFMKSAKKSNVVNDSTRYAQFVEFEQAVMDEVIKDYAGKLGDSDEKDSDTSTSAINGSMKFNQALRTVVASGKITGDATGSVSNGKLLIRNKLASNDVIGVYLIYPKDSTNQYVYNPTAAFVRYDYNEKGEVTSIPDVIVKAKGILNIVNKTVDEGSKSLAIGDTAEYTITSTYPTFADQYKDTAIYTISDTSEQLKDYNVVSVTLGGNTLTKGTQYTVENHPSGRGFVIKLLDGNGSLPAFEETNCGKEVKVNYTAVVESLNTDGQVKNTATVTTQPDSNSDAWTTDSVVITDTYEVHITKVNEYGHTLSGAIFQAVRKDGKYVTFSYDSNTKTYKVKGYSDTLTSECKINVSSRLGVTLAGLDAEETYTLTEIQAPSGYLKSDATIVLGKSNASLGITVTTTNRQYKSESGIDTSETVNTVETNVTEGFDLFNIDYTNKKLFDLPETGCFGTYIFTLVGVAIIVTAVIINRNRKRNKAEA